MRILRILTGVVALNTAVLWGIIGMNMDSAVTYPSRGLVGWGIMNAIVCIVTQCISFAAAMDDGE